MEFMFQAFRNLLGAAAGSVLGWLGRLVRNLIIAFLLSGTAATAVGVGVVFAQTRAAPTQTSWLIIALIAVIAALVTFIGTAIVLLVKSLLRLVRSAGSGSFFESRPPTSDNVRQFPRRGPNDRRVS